MTFTYQPSPLLQAVAFAGPEDSGKDTAARLFTREWVRRGHSPPDVRWIADRLRRAADELGVPSLLTRDLKNYHSPEIRDHRGRDVLGALGRTVADLLGSTWCLEREVEAHEVGEPTAVLVIVDARRPEEIQWLDRAGALTVWIDRPGRSTDLLATATARAACHRELDNSLGLQHLAAGVAEIADLLGQPRHTWRTSQ